MTDAPTPAGPRQTSWALAAAGWLFLAGALALAYVLFSGMSKPGEGVGLARYAQGSLARLVVLPAPPPQSTRAFQDAEGQKKTFADFRGKTVLVQYWATWCTTCPRVMPTLAPAQAALAGKPFEVVSISLDRLQDLPQARAKHGRLIGASIPFHIDPTTSIALDAGISALPAAVLYDPRGGEIARIVGVPDWSSPEGIAALTAALDTP